MDDNVINALFYFYSTIAQASAAVFALSTVFLLRKFDLLDKELRKLEQLKSLAQASKIRGEFSIKFRSFSLENFYASLEDTDDSNEASDFSQKQLKTLKMKKAKLKQLFTCVSLFWIILVCLNLLSILLVGYFSESQFCCALLGCINAVFLCLYGWKQWVLISKAFLEYRD